MIKLVGTMNREIYTKIICIYVYLIYYRNDNCKQDNFLNLIADLRI